MRNRYQRDLNRLVKHPRRNPSQRQLRSPGALNGTFAAASGLPRDPVQTDLDIFLLDDEYRIIRMSPDMTVIKETLVTDDHISSFAIHNDRYLYAQHDTAAPNTTNYVTFNNGATIATNWDPNGDYRRIVGTNQTHALVHFLDEVTSIAYIERYDWDGTFVGRTSYSDANYSVAELFWVIPASGDHAFVSGYGPPSGGQQGFFKFNILTGAKTFVADNNKFWGDFCTSDRYYSVISEFNNERVLIYDLNLNVLGTLALNRNNPTSFCVANKKAYCFFGGSFSQETFVQIYARDGDTFTLESQFDLNQTLGLRYIRVAMPDMAEVL